MKQKTKNSGELRIFTTAAFTHSFKLVYDQDCWFGFSLAATFGHVLYSLHLGLTIGIKSSDLFRGAELAVAEI